MSESHGKNLHKTERKCIIYIRGGYMLKRKITKILEEWKKEENKQCLLIRGARQVGN